MRHAVTRNRNTPQSLFNDQLYARSGVLFDALTASQRIITRNEAYSKIELGVNIHNAVNCHAFVTSA